MIDMMDVITHGEGGWLPQTNTSVFTNIITKKWKYKYRRDYRQKIQIQMMRYDECYH